MNTTYETLYEIKEESFTLKVEAACYNEGASWHFEEQWEALKEHTQGAIRNPFMERGTDTQFFKPLQYSLDQLAKDFAKQGKDNPSRKAFVSLQSQLRYDLWAQDCSLVVSVSYNDISLIERDQEIGFIWSPEGTSDLEEEGKSVADEYFDKEEWITKGKTALHELREAICC